MMSKKPTSQRKIKGIDTNIKVLEKHELGGCEIMTSHVDGVVTTVLLDTE